MRSTDGSIWEGVAFGAGRFVLTTKGRCEHSTDGVSFSPCIGTGTNADGKGVFFVNGTFFFLRGDGLKSFRSVDGITWVESTVSIPGSGLAYSHGIYVAVEWSRRWVATELGMWKDLGSNFRPGEVIAAEQSDGADRAQTTYKGCRRPSVLALRYLVSSRLCVQSVWNARAN